MNSSPNIAFHFPAFSGFIGVSEVDITPPVGIYMGNWGASESPVSTGIHQPLLMTCMTFQKAQQDPPLVLIGVDLGWWKDGSDEKAFRQAILHRLDLKPAHLLVCLSHTHSGPSLSRMDAAKPGGDLVLRYLNELEEKAIALIQSALQSAEDAYLTWRYGRSDLACNRDLPDPASDRYLVGFNPVIPADDTLLCGLVTNKIGEKKGVIVNYACHPTTLGWTNTLVSPDFPGTMKKTISAKTSTPVLFMQGASGNLAPIINYSGDPQIPERYGRQLGYAVLSTLESISIPGRQYAYQSSVESGAPLAIWEEDSATISNDLQAICLTSRYGIKDFPVYDELEKLRENSTDRVERERLWRKMGIRKALGDGDEASMNLWIWKLGDAYLVAQPNEAYSDLQIEIRSLFPDLAIAVANLVNGSYGYLPPRDLYDADIYAVWQTPFAQGSLEKLVRQVHQNIQNLEHPS